MRPDLDAIRKRMTIIQRDNNHVEYNCETPYTCHENVRLLLGDLDALLAYIEELEGKQP